MKIMKNVLIVTAGVAAGMVVANYLTEGAVFDAGRDIFTNAKDGILNKGQGVGEAVGDVAENVADAVNDVIA